MPSRTLHPKSRCCFRWGNLPTKKNRESCPVSRDLCPSGGGTCPSPGSARTGSGHAEHTREKRCPRPPVSVSADSKGLAGEVFVSADSKGVISPLFPADPRGASKCGVSRGCGRGVLEVRIVKDLAER